MPDMGVLGIFKNKESFHEQKKDLGRPARALCRFGDGTFLRRDHCLG
jgi:hypothetical protein